jgi:UDP-glucoronosyl and UDP-glucosyl transferase
MKNQIPVPFFTAITYPHQACDAALSDPKTKHLLNTSNFDLMIIDSSFAECALAMQYKLNVPFMFLNTVGYHTAMISISGSPAPYSITPLVIVGLTDNMNFLERAWNSFMHLGFKTTRMVSGS